MEKYISKKFIIGISYFLNIVVFSILMFYGVMDGNPSYMIIGAFIFAMIGIHITKNDQRSLVNIYKKINEY